MELLNSKINHPDYQCNSTPWGVVLKTIKFRSFQAIVWYYHIQIDEGDIIELLEIIINYRSYHTAGVPGRNEIDDTQELNYSAIMKAIHETGFKGYVAQEFIPKRIEQAWILKRQLQFVIFNDYKNRTHDKEEL
jgi:hydroxypyruvate isomerase